MSTTVVSLDERKREPTVRWLDRAELALDSACEELGRLPKTPGHLSIWGVLQAARHLTRTARFFLIDETGFARLELEAGVQAARQSERAL